MTQPTSATAHPWRENLETAAIAIVMALILKYFTLEAFQIPTGSMQPTLMGLDARVTQISNGRQVPVSTKIFDRILVDKLIPFVRGPNRWEIWVFLYPLDRANRYIKRVVGLPGEELKIEHGDIKVRKSAAEEFRVARKPPRIQESMWLNVWNNDDDRKPSAYFDLTNFTEQNHTISAAGSAKFATKKTIFDTYEDGYPEKVKPLLVTSQHEPDHNRVRDLRLTIRTTPSAEHQQLSMRLGWGGDALRVEIPGPSAGEGKLKITFNDREIASKEVKLKFGQENLISFARADEAAEVFINGESVARSEFESTNTPGENSVSLATEGGTLTIHSIELDRDVYYTNMQGFRSATIPEGNYFMLGDNSLASADGRAWMEKTIYLNSPVDGMSKLVGGTRTSGASSDWNPRRFNMPGQPGIDIFRDEFGEEYRIGESTRRVDIARYFVPADHFLGRAFFVFWPWPPFSPAVRIGVVR
ncbi:MAG: signal peptidase I [Planctomycetota bacterium]